MSKQQTFHNWPQIRDALEKAYRQLGLSMEQTGPGSSQYNDDHWNIAGLVYNQAVADLKDCGSGACRNCRVKLTFETVIRCLDCGTQLCETCAPAHFGPNHSTRAQAAHGT